MLPLQPYRPGKYPPGPGWAEFGDDQLAHSVAHGARATLVAKRQEMAHFHIGRLQEDGYMPLHAPEEFCDAVDPEDQARAAYDHPTMRSRNPYMGPDAPMGTQTDAYVEAGTGPDDGHDRPDHGGGGIRRPAVITPFARGVGGGFNSTAADMGSTVVERSIQGLGWLAGAGVRTIGGGVLNGTLRAVGLRDNEDAWADHADDETPPPLAITPSREREEPMGIGRKPRAKAKAEPMSAYYGSGASSSSSLPQRAPFGVNWVSVPPVVIDLSADDVDAETEDAEAPQRPAAPAARPRRARRPAPGFRQIAQDDVAAARATLAAMGELRRRRNGRAQVPDLPDQM